MNLRNPKNNHKYNQKINNLFLLNIPRIKVFDGVRALAIIGVFNFHFWAVYRNTTGIFAGSSTFSVFMHRVVDMNFSGFLGVDTLFMLSGFFALRSIDSRKYSFGNYIVKRYARLLPVIFFIVLLPGLGMYPLKDYIDNILFLKFFRDSRYLNFVTWVLTYEMYFYLMIGIMFIVLKRMRSRIIFFILFNIIIFQKAFYPIPDRPRPNECVKMM
jgi:peptidoglycan/LPS O-acetylase OafA/YrhL